MITVVVLKILHYVSIFLAGGLGVANVILLRIIKKPVYLLHYQSRKQ